MKAVLVTALLLTMVLSCGVGAFAKTKLTV